MGRNYITNDDLSLPVKVVLSTASIDRVNIFSLLIARGGTLKTSDIVTSFNMSAPTARAAMTQLKATGLVDILDTTTETEEKQITLKDDFDWFLGEEFAKLREKFEPVDNTIEMRERQEQQHQQEVTKKETDKSEFGSNDSRCLKEKCPLLPSTRILLPNMIPRYWSPVLSAANLRNPSI